MNISLALGRRSGGKACFPLGDGQKVESTRTRAFQYPDVTVFCGKPRVGAKDEHVVVFPDTRRVEHRKRVGADEWQLLIVVAGELGLTAIDSKLPLDEIYANLERVETA